jgi:prepilin-type N-terminal cleavage/methylation domain-containing protein
VPGILDRPRPRPRRRPRSARRGFTLIEILIALAILVIGMVGVMAAFASAIELHKRGVDQTSAALLAQTILQLKQAEALEGKTADEMSTRSGGLYVFKPSENYPGYECKIICTDLSPREFQLVVEVRLRPREVPGSAASDTEMEKENVRFETILLHS